MADPATRAANDAVDAVRHAVLVEPVGSRTHAEIGHAPPAHSTAVRVTPGIVRHDPDDLTVRVLAGTPVSDLDAALAPSGQFVPLDPRDPGATVGGTIATGLSGLRRLGFGPIRDYVLEVRFVTGYGELVRGGGPTVKNVTGYDLPRLLVGSLGSLGVIVDVTLRCRPRPPVIRWWSTTAPAVEVWRRLFRPAAVVADGARTLVLFSGEAGDERAVAELPDAIEAEAPRVPDAAHRGRISVPPAGVDAVATDLDAHGLRWLAEYGVGTVHVAGDTPDALLAAREIAEAHGGWLLREAGAPGLDPFGRPLPNLALQRRVKLALDPDHKLARGRFDSRAPVVVS